VRFAAGGFIPTEELPCYYNAADIYVSTSLSDGTSLSLLEAMGCALPVVVTDVPSITEWITDGHNGRVVPRRQPEAVAQALVELLGAPERRRQFGERNRELAVARGDSTANYEQLIAFYQYLAARPERG
jgi:glycosyltransferase involved in cell wall biosynthesis